MKKKIVISEKVTAVMLAAAMTISMTACGSPAKDMQGAAETAAEELPKTGDHSSPAMWLLLIGAGMAVSLFVAVSGRRDEE